ncbi:MAG: hypothetical protein ACJAUT_000650 [Cellvibrionaceae bacterium]|jgi:hypothetical protein
MDVSRTLIVAINSSLNLLALSGVVFAAIIVDVCFFELAKGFIKSIQYRQLN